VNDSGTPTNACMRKVIVKGIPHLVLFATKNINAGEEILYNYGDKSHNLWWRRKVMFILPIHL